MRVNLTVVGMLVGAMTLLPTAAPAAPGEERRPPAPVNPLDVERYVRSLLPPDPTGATELELGALRQIRIKYVRPLPMKELVRAALTGLYEAAQQPVPTSLARDLEAADDDEARLSKLLKVYRERVGDVEFLRNSQDTIVSLRALTRILDPYSVVMTLEEVRQSNSQAEEALGVGIMLLPTAAGSPLRVKTVFPGSQAQRAGFRPGDEIVSVNRQPAEHLRAPDVQRRLNGEGVPFDPTTGLPAKPEPVEIVFRRGGTGGPRTASLTPKQFRTEAVFGARRREDNSWDFFPDPAARVGYARLAFISHGTPQELRAALDVMAGEGLTGLILDLRWCPGGWLKEAVEIADMFLQGGVIALQKSRDPKANEQYNCTGAGPVTDVPMVVLINGATSGAGEMIAAALQDHRRAVLIGERTIGKGSVQVGLTLLLDGVGMRVTHATLQRSTGVALNRFSDSKPQDDWGVKPTPGFDLRLSPALSRRLRDWWELQTLRPGTDDDALPLDVPGLDPQLDAAVERLRLPPLTRGQIRQITLLNLLPRADLPSTVVWGVGAAVITVPKTHARAGR